MAFNSLGHVARSAGPHGNSRFPQCFHWTGFQRFLFLIFVSFSFSPPKFLFVLTCPLGDTGLIVHGRRSHGLVFVPSYHPHDLGRRPPFAEVTCLSWHKADLAPEKPIRVSSHPRSCGKGCLCLRFGVFSPNSASWRCVRVSVGFLPCGPPAPKVSASSRDALWLVPRGHAHLGHALLSP